MAKRKKRESASPEWAALADQARPWKDRRVSAGAMGDRRKKRAKTRGARKVRAMAEFE